MKKILLTTAALAAISTSAFAEGTGFYVRGDVDAARFSGFKANDTKIKPKFGFGFDLGAGYYITDSVRAELVLNLPFVSKMKSKTVTTTVTDPTGNSLTTKSVTTYKPTVRALFARVAADVVDFGAGKVFVTGGLGLAQVSSKVVDSHTQTVTPKGSAALTPTKKTDTYKAKNKTNFAWTIGAGTTCDVAEAVHLDVAYSYRDYGSSKIAKDGKYTLANSKAKMRSHNVSAGIRFDI